MTNIEQKLTKREREVIELVCQGLTNPQIGKRLFISKDCVRFHLINIFAKLDAISRTHAAVMWTTRRCSCQPLPVERRRAQAATSKAAQAQATSSAADRS